MFAIDRSHLTEFGLLLGVAGAVLIVAGAGMFLRSPSADQSVRQRSWTLVGASVIAVSFAVQLAGRFAR